MKLSRSSRWLLVVMILVGLGGWAVTGLSIYTRLVYFGLLLLVGAAAWTFLSMRGVHLQRKVRTLRASVGEVFEERFEVQKDAWLGCSWLEVLNQSGLPMAAGSRLLTGIGARQRRFYIARSPLTRRGAFLLGPTVLTSGDPFGLFTVRKQIPAKDTLVILPMSFPISTFPPPRGLLPGGKMIHQRTQDVTPHAAGVREYVPGDPMKRVHWPSTAHRGRFMVKEFEQDPQADIWIFLDAQHEIHSSLPEPPLSFKEDGWLMRHPKITLPRDTFEYAVSVVASLTSYFLADRRAVGLACAAGKFTIVPAERGERQVNKIMETLAFLQSEGKMPLLGLVGMQASLLPRGSGVILVTSSACPGLLLAVEDLQRRNLRPLVVLIKSETFGGASRSKKVTAGIMQRNIPFCQIGLGDDLGIQLTLPVVYFQRPSASWSSFGG